MNPVRSPLDDLAAPTADDPVAAAAETPAPDPDPGSGSEAGVTGADAALRESQDRFIEIWGNMGSTWGIQRSMAEVHALLFIVGEPMNTDEIMERLHISRGSASMSLRSLVEWGVVGRIHKRGDRKEYFQAEQDVWQMFRIIVRERKRREIDPLRAALADCRDVTAPVLASGHAEPAVRDHQRRVEEMMEFIELITMLTEKFTGPSGKGLRMAAGLLRKGVES